MMGQFARHRTSRSSPPSTTGRNVAGFIATFLLTAVFWLLFSGKLDVFHLSLGAVSCLLVAGFSSDLLFPKGVEKHFFGTWIRFARYIPWLLYEILLANLYVLYLVFHPRMMDIIDPRIVEFESTLKGDIARTTFANSITLTPGTITVSVDALGRFRVHCIDARSGQSLPGEMQERIRAIFKK